MKLNYQQGALLMEVILSMIIIAIVFILIVLSLDMPLRQTKQTQRHKQAMTESIKLYAWVAEDIKHSKGIRLSQDHKTLEVSSSIKYVCEGNEFTRILSEIKGTLAKKLSQCQFKWDEATYGSELSLTAQWEGTVPLVHQWVVYYD